MSKHANVMPFGRNNGHQSPMYDPSQAVPKACECGCGRFAQVFHIAFISNLAPGNRTGRDLIIPVPVFVCVQCGKELGAKVEPEVTEEKGSNDES